MASRWNRATREQSVSRQLVKVCRTGLQFWLHEVYLRIPDSVIEHPRPIVFAATHQGYFDGYLAYIATARMRRSFRVQASTQVVRSFPILAKLGVVPAQAQDPYTAARALRSAAETLQKSPSNCLWMFPQGRYERIPSHGSPELGAFDYTLTLRPGAVELARQAGSALICPVAIRYDYLRYRRPVAFLDIGAGIQLKDTKGGARADKEYFTGKLQSALDNQHQLLQTAIIEHPTEFQSCLRSSSGALVAGQHLEKADIERQLYGLKAVKTARVVCNPKGTAPSSGKTLIDIRVAADPTLSTPDIVNYLCEKYHLDDHRLRTAFETQVSITLAT